MAKAKPWERRPGEPDRAHELFLRYRDLGRGRTLEKVAEMDPEDIGARDPTANPKCIKGVSVSSLRRHSTRWGWVERCRAWDDHIQAQKDREVAREAAKWERRRREELERTYQLGQVLLEKAEAMLRMPLVRKRLEKDGKTTVLEPARWNMGDAIRAAEMSVKITDAVFAAVAKDPAEMNDAELEGTANPEDFT